MLDFSKKVPNVFSYKDCEITDGKTKEFVKRPFALISIGNENLDIGALIDTGSDKTISYMYPFGKMLGLNPETIKTPKVPIKGLFGGGEAWPIPMDIWIGDRKFNIPIYWLDKTYNLVTDNYPVILGRKTIFDNYDVIFCQKDMKVYFYSR